MYYEFLEDTAQKNAIRDVNPYTKLLLGLGAIVIAVFSENFVTPLFIAISLSLVTIFFAGINPRFYAKLLLIPAGFAIISVIVIILISGGGEVFWSWRISDCFGLSITSGSLDKGLTVLCRVFGGMCALFFISLTTPMTELFSIMKKGIIPDVLVDLAMIIYRLIFILIEQAVQIYSSQLMRLGYARRKEAINSFGQMCGSLFINSWIAGEDFVRAMECRCYEGKFATFSEIEPVSARTVLPVAAYLLFTLILLVFSNNMTLF